MKLAPSQWKGTARRLIEEVLQPHFLPAAAVEAWQTLLKRRMDDADPTFVIGAPSPDLRSRWGNEKMNLTKHDSRVMFGDRASATAVYTSLLSDGPFTSEKMTALFMHLPFHAFDLDKFTRWAALTNNIASAGWMTAHIFPGGSAGENWENLSKDELRKKTIRNLHPMNIFIFPNLNKSGTVFADDPRFHALMAEAYKKKYGALYDSYLALTGDDVASLPAPDDFEIDLSAKSTAPASVKLESKELVSKIDPTTAFDLKLITVPESQGYHSRSIEPTLLTRGFYDVKLESKDKGGETKTIGFFRLNLKDLYEKKYLARDAKGLKLLVYKTDDGFAIGPKKTGPLVTLPS